MQFERLVKLKARRRSATDGIASTETQVLRGVAETRLLERDPPVHPHSYRRAKRRNCAVQLRRVTPYEDAYASKVAVTNATLSSRKLLALRDSGGAREGVFAELKSQA